MKGYGDDLEKHGRLNDFLNSVITVFFYAHLNLRMADQCADIFESKTKNCITYM